jgi:predicted chitinase
MSESGIFNYTSEIGATDAHYKGFKGRGLIQITGIDNYSAYEDYEGEDFTPDGSDMHKISLARYRGIAFRTLQQEQ